MWEGLDWHCEIELRAEHQCLSGSSQLVVSSVQRTLLCLDMCWYILSLNQVVCCKIHSCQETVSNKQQRQWRVFLSLSTGVTDGYLVLWTVEIQKNKKAESRAGTDLQKIGTICQNHKIFSFLKPPWPFFHLSYSVCKQQLILIK